MTDRKFYKTIITLEVLSEEPIPAWMEAEDIVRESSDGSFSMATVGNNEVELDGKQMVGELNEQGSDPEFFNLTDDGEDIDNDE